MSAPRPLHDRLLRFLYRERAAGACDIEEIWATPLSTRVAAGDALPDLRFGEFLDGGPRFTLRFSENRSRFRPGDTLRLGRGEDAAREVEVSFLDEDRAQGWLLLEASWGTDRRRLQKLLSSAGELVLDRSVFDLSERVATALSRALAGESPHQRRVRALLEAPELSVPDPRRTSVSTHHPASHPCDSTPPAQPSTPQSAPLPDESSLHSHHSQPTSAFPPTLDPDEADQAIASLERLAEHGLQLNPSQREAYLATWASRSLQLVQGPPGTGKTWLLALVAAALAWRGARLLITAFTHRAVDNALLDIARLIEAFNAPLDLARINPRRNERWTLEAAGIRLIAGPRRLGAPSRGRGQIVGATVISALALAEASFDRVFFDEAAQIPLAYGAGALLAGRRWSLFGDDRQLGPVVVGEHPDVGADASLFAHLRPIAPPLLLDESYRLNEALCAFPSQAFYEGRLKPADLARKRRFEAGTKAKRLRHLLAPEPPALLITVPHEGFRTHAPAEVRLAAELATELLVSCELPAEELAIISPFRLQSREIQRALFESLGSEAELPVMDTVERIQGQEREVVIVSLCCSDPDALRRDARFFFSPQRLCVTLTRARTKLIVIASPALLRTIPHNLDALTDLARFHRLFAALPRITRAPDGSETT